MSLHRQRGSSRTSRQVFPTVLDTQPLLPPTKLLPSAGSKSGAPLAVPDSVGDFRLLTTFTVPEASEIQVAKYMSLKTGLKVVWASTPGPLVNGYITVPTEIWDSSGCPHTLEHLSFQGSHDYPFVGTLSHVIERLYGTLNGWTELTSTNYSCIFGSGEGYLEALPVYLDGVLYPNLTQEAFDTEVYCINGKGEEGGAVFSEMQGRQGSLGDLVNRRSAELLYSTDSAYRSETGGVLSALRKLKLDQIHDFHSYAYRPQNTTVTAIGSAITPTQLLQTISNSIERSIVEHGDAHGPRPAGWKRPWIESKTAQNPPKIARKTKETLYYPSQDDSTGTLIMTWLGPGPSDLLGALALQIVITYLSATAVSPLQQAFIQGSNPIFSTINISKGDMDPNTFFLEADNVAIKALGQLDQKVDAILEHIAAGAIDMERIESIIRALESTIRNQQETTAADYVFANVQNDILWGSENANDLADTFDDFARLGQLANWPSSWWARFITKFFLAPSIRLVCTPSAALAEKNADDEKKLVALHKAKLGVEGLHAQGKRLAASVAKNAERAPPSVINKFLIPDASSIDWLSVETARSSGGQPDGAPFRNKTQRKVDADGELPLFVQFDHLPESEFIQLTVCMSEHLTEDEIHLLDLLPTFVNSFFGLPTSFRGQSLAYKDSIAQLESDTLSYSFGNAGDAVVFSIRLEKGKYELGIEWLNALLFCSTFSPARLVACVQQQLGALSDIGQDGDSLASTGMLFLETADDAPSGRFNSLVLRETLPKLLARLKSDPRSVVADFERLRAALTNPRAMRIGVQADMSRIAHPIQAWKNNFSIEAIDEARKGALLPVTRSLDHLSKLGRRPAKKVLLFPLPAIESTFSYWTSAGPIGWDHPDAGALGVACEMLNALEGDLTLFSAVRGKGFAYNVFVDRSDELGRVQLCIFRSPDAFIALEAARALVQNIVDCKPGAIITDDILKSAKSLKCLGFILGNGSNYSQAADTSFANLVLKDEPADMKRQSMEAALKVTAEDVRRVIARYFLPLFNAKTSIGSIATAPGKAKELVEEMKARGYDVETVDLSAAHK